MTKRTNTDTWTEVRFSDGESVTFKRRATFGGWVNMVRKIETQFGGDVRCVSDDGSTWSVAGRTFTTHEWSKA